MTGEDRQDEGRGPRALSPLRDFLATESAGAVLIAVGAVAALVWANSPWRGVRTNGSGRATCRSPSPDTASTSPCATGSTTG